jgi:hypothetical protein
LSLSTNQSKWGKFQVFSSPASAGVYPWLCAYIPNVSQGKDYTVRHRLFGYIKWYIPVWLFLSYFLLYYF